MALAGVTCGVVALAERGLSSSEKHGTEGPVTWTDWGPHLGDYGSGFHIGTLALRAAAKYGWHPRHHTSLAEPVYRAWCERERDAHGYGLVAYTLAPRDRAEIAALAKVVDAEANQGDTIARRILEEAERPWRRRSSTWWNAWG